MHKKIKELAEQSGLKVESWMTNPPKPFQILGSAEEFEKFAELIIKECMEVASPNYMSTPSDSVYYVEQAIIRIEEHFGIEE